MQSSEQLGTMEAFSTLDTPSKKSKTIFLLIDDFTLGLSL